MAYSSMEECLLDLEKNGQLARIKEETDPNLQMAAIQLRVYEAGGPALLFENVKGSRYRAVSNVFGTIERSRFIFRDTLQTVQRLIDLKSNPVQAFKHPFQNLGAGLAALKAFPLKNPSVKPVLQERISIADLPLIKHWPKDGGAFVTLPQVYTEDTDQPGIMNSNLGMYRIQLNGNDYTLNKEIGLHYQIHRGIGVHQAKANQKGLPLKVSIFVGGPPAHSVSAVMPLPEGISEMTFAGVLGGRRFRYVYEDGYCISTDADFVITGEVFPGDNKLEGPFGDHLGYYSLQHDFPLMKVHKVYAKKNGIWAFTVVGRPPQEDTSFGQLIHKITGKAVQQEIPGLKEVHAVDAAGVHPLLLAIGSERYVPYAADRQPQELLTNANAILGQGQLSLAKYLLIVAQEDDRSLDIHDIGRFLQHLLRRVDWTRDLHFQTRTTIDTLDYSGTGLNAGSKLVIAAAGQPQRELATEISGEIFLPDGFTDPSVCLPGVLAVKAPPWSKEAHGTDPAAGRFCDELLHAPSKVLAGWPLMVLVDDARFCAESLRNFLWVTFTRSNPAADVYGVAAFVEAKHWGCRGPLVIDARMKPHMAPPLEPDPVVSRRVDALAAPGGPLHGLC